MNRVSVRGRRTSGSSFAVRQALGSSTRLYVKNHPHELSRSSKENHLCSVSTCSHEGTAWHCTEQSCDYAVCMNCVYDHFAALPEDYDASMATVDAALSSAAAPPTATPVVAPHARQDRSSPATGALDAGPSSAASAAPLVAIGTAAVAAPAAARGFAAASAAAASAPRSSAASSHGDIVLVKIAVPSAPAHPTAAADQTRWWPAVLIEDAADLAGMRDIPSVSPAMALDERCSSAARTRLEQRLAIEAPQRLARAKSLAAQEARRRRRESHAAAAAAAVAASASASSPRRGVLDAMESPNGTLHAPVDTTLWPKHNRTALPASIVVKLQRLRQQAAVRAQAAGVTLTPPSPNVMCLVMNGSLRFTVREGEFSFMYRYILRESCSQFDSLPLTSLQAPSTSAAARTSSTHINRRNCNTSTSLSCPRAHSPPHRRAERRRGGAHAWRRRRQGRPPRSARAFRRPRRRGLRPRRRALRAALPRARRPRPLPRLAAPPRAALAQWRRARRSTAPHSPPTRPGRASPAPRRHRSRMRTRRVSFLLCTVTFYANLAHSLTRSP